MIACINLSLPKEFAMVDGNVPYGTGHVSFTLPDTAPTTFVQPLSVPGIPDQAGEVARALDNALSTYSLPTEGDAVVVVSDPTRPVPNTTILPILLGRMEAAGIAAERTTILVASGLHLPAKERAIREILGDAVCERYRVVQHDYRDRDNLVYLGTTGRGTPVWINKLFMESKIRFLTGVIEPHQFAGFSGGWKSVAVGLAGEETVTGSHALLLDPRSTQGVFQDNPTRNEIDEIGELVGDALALNVIINNDRQIVAALAGSPGDVESAGVELSSRIAQVEIPKPFDIVIASPGGNPKDLEMYQAQKAVLHAEVAVRQGGTIILVAECPLGAGNQRFEDWMGAAAEPQDVIARLKRDGFQVGAHKAFLLARTMLKARVMLVSDRMPTELAKKLMLEPHETIESALESAFARHGLNATVAVMPKASSTIPRLACGSQPDSQMH
jgi:lactate racemase